MKLSKRELFKYKKRKFMKYLNSRSYIEGYSLLQIVNHKQKQLRNILFDTLAKKWIAERPYLSAQKKKGLLL